jgi:hypothetical protein
MLCTVGLSAKEMRQDLGDLEEEEEVVILLCILDTRESF